MNNPIIVIIMLSLVGVAAIDFNDSRRLRKAMAARVDALGLKPYSAKLFDY